MTTYTWKNPVSGAWTNAADWSPPGGPKVAPGFIGTYDAAVFATGSASPYTVTGSGESGSLTITGDHVTFTNFQNGDAGYGGSLTVNGGGFVTVGAASALSYIAHDGYGGGALTVTDATLVDRGEIDSAGGTLTDSLLTITGTAARLASLYDLNILTGSTLRVTDGGLYTVLAGEGAPSEIDGTLSVSGTGSKAALVNVAGTGTVRIGAGASVTDFIMSGSLRFVLSQGASLEIRYSAASTDTIFLTGGDATVTLRTPVYTLATPILGFAATDALLFEGTAVTAASYAGGMLHLFDGTRQVGQVRLVGNYAGDSFDVTAVSATEGRVTLAVPPQITGTRDDTTTVIASLPPRPHFLAGASGTAPGWTGPAGATDGRPPPAWRESGAGGTPDPHGGWFRFHSPLGDGAMPPLWHAAA